MAKDDEQTVYFDNAASARPDPRVVELAGKIALSYYANPASIHDFGSECDEYLTQARKQIVSLLAPDDDKANPFECIFTSGATEGNNIAILGAALAQESYSKTIITTTAEHSSVSKVFDRLAKEGFRVIRIPVHLDGDIDWDMFLKALKEPFSLISAMEVSNQNGAILPIAKMAKMAKEANPRALFHTDATQSICKLATDFSNVDMVTFSGHKIGGLRGTGALLKRSKSRLVPPEVGGGQEAGLRSGTANTPGDVSLALALRLGLESLPNRAFRAKEINDRIREGLVGMEDLVEVISPLGNAIPFVLTLGLKKQRASVMDQYLSGKGIFVSTTSACDDKHDGPNAILRAMGLASHIADNPIRLSFTGNEDLKEADMFLKAFIQGLKSLKFDI